MHEILWHGRGGQGAVLAAQILGEAAYCAGFRGITSAPTFGPERRGAPVTASTRISDDPIRTFSQIECADIAVVLDATLLGMVDILGRLKEGGLIIINTPLSAGAHGINGAYPYAHVDASTIALENRLTIAGAPVINTPMLGAVAKATGLVSLAHLEKALRKKMPQERASSNFAAIAAAYDKTIVGREKEENE